MPKHDLFIKPGEILPEKLRSLLTDYFSEMDFEKLSKFGGRIQLSITAPFTDRKTQDDTLNIDEAFVNEIKENPIIAADRFRTMTKKQLERVADLLSFPTTSKSTTKEIMHALIEYLNSGAKWEKISGGTTE